MKITKLPKEERLYRDMGFIQIHFSFRPDFKEQKRRNFGILYTLDDAYMPPNSRGFGMHPHRDLEVVTLFLEGEGHHEDTNGHIGVTKAKAVQLITSGSGILHEEYNFSKEKPFRAIQMFLHPKKKGIKPEYQKRELKPAEYQNKIVEIISPSGRNNSLKIANDSYLSYGILEEGSQETYNVNEKAKNGVFLKVISGEIEVNGFVLREKDEIGIEEANQINIRALVKAEIMIFEVPMKI